jgi:four helix bundle protein
MKGENIQQRCKSITVQIIKMAPLLPMDYSSQVLGRQIIRSSASVGANYRSACGSKSRKDFVNKMKTVEEELDETIYWLEVIGESGFFSVEQLKGLSDECNQLLSIVVMRIKTARENEKINMRMPEMTYRE